MSDSDQLPTEAHQELQARHILIADDSKAMRDYLHALLKDLGLSNISEAADGNQALNVLAEKPADILFCDLSMPGLDGVELLRHLAIQSPDISVVPISSLEARLRFGVSQMAHKLGLRVLGILGKPFEESELIECLIRFVANQSSGTQDDEFDEDAFSAALKARRVHIHFQPQVRMLDGKVLGFEALVRMSDQEGQLIAPSAFIGMSESTGQIHRLSHLIIETSIRQLSTWSRLGHDFNLSINFSAKTLKKLDLPEHVEAIARNRGISNSQLTIELTESQLNEGPELYDVMSRFRMKGFGLSIDDFGTGESGLTRLRSLPFTELKIDQEFVKGCTHDSDLQSIVSNSIHLGQELGMLVVAEGVQTQEEWDFLKSSGCDIAQGFLISRPLPPEKVLSWLDQWDHGGRQKYAARS